MKAPLAVSAGSKDGAKRNGSGPLTGAEGIAVVALVGLTLAAGAIAGVPLPHSTWLLPAVLSIATLADFGTGLIILGGQRPADVPRSTRILCATFIVLGLLSAIGIVTWERDDAIFTGLWRWLFLAWPLVLGAGGVAFAEIRRIDWAAAGHENAPRRALQRSVTWSSAAVSGLAGWALATHAYGNPSAVQPFHIAESITIALCAFAATRCWWTSKAASVTRAFSVALVGVTGGLLLHAAAPAQFSVGWYTEWSLYLLSSLIVTFSGLRVLLRTRASLREAERSIAVSNLRFVQRGEVLRALRRSAVEDGWTDRNGTHAVLEAGASNIRRDRPICGILAHIDGDDLVLDARTTYGDEPVLRAIAASMYPGRRFALAGSLSALICKAGRTLWWNRKPESDFHPEDDELGWKSLIGSSIEVGSQCYLLLFVSTDEMIDDPFSDDDATFIEALTLHISHRFFEQQQQERIQFHVENDALTGLRNRAEFGHTVRAAVRKRRPFAVAVVDLDSFRQINEADGHGVGDQVLVNVATSLSDVDGRDVVARLGADDFAILLADIPDEDALAARLAAYRGVFSRPLAGIGGWSAHGRTVTASFGVAMYPRDGATAEELMQRADVTLDVSKQRGVGGALIYTHDLDVEVRNRRHQREEILEAIQSDALLLEYQPTFEMSSRAIAGAEALIRWNHPTRGLLAPNDFIPCATRNGLMGALSHWAFARVLRDFADRELPPGFRCYVNLPAFLLDDIGFLREMDDVLDAHRSFVEHLGVEITESDAVQNAESTILALRRIRARGVRIAVDDFGTGYSSMAYLKRLPIDIIKIDRSFIAGLPDDGKDGVLCEMFLRLTQQFGFVSLAEGIETEAQAAWLLEHGCLMGQGFLFSKPVPIAMLLPMIETARDVVPARTPDAALLRST